MLDPSATESSCGGESADEMDKFQPGAAAELYPPLQERAKYKVRHNKDTEKEKKVRRTGIYVKLSETLDGKPGIGKTGPAGKRKAVISNLELMPA